MPTKNGYEISGGILGTGFSMQIRMLTQNMYEISGTGIEHWIQHGDNNAH
jgi:hypothetical protein